MGCVAGRGLFAGWCPGGQRSERRGSCDDILGLADGAEEFVAGALDSVAGGDVGGCCGALVEGVESNTGPEEGFGAGQGFEPFVGRGAISPACSGVGGSMVSEFKVRGVVAVQEGADLPEGANPFGAKCHDHPPTIYAPDFRPTSRLARTLLGASLTLLLEGDSGGSALGPPLPAPCRPLDAPT